MIDFSTLRDFPPVDFYFVRHGKSEGNLQELVQGRLDFPLSDIGRQQAVSTGVWFQGKPVRVVFSTPLQRGFDTARVIASVASFPDPEPLDALVEMDTGSFTGITLEQARTKYPEMYKTFLQKSWEGVEGAERISGLKERAATVWNSLIQRTARIDPRTENRIGVLAISHAGLLQWIVKLTLGSESWFPLLPMGDCCVYQFSVHGTVSRWVLLNFQAPGVTGSR